MTHRISTMPRDVGIEQNLRLVDVQPARVDREKAALDRRGTGSRGSQAPLS